MLRISCVYWKGDLNALTAKLASNTQFSSGKSKRYNNKYKNRAKPGNGHKCNKPEYWTAGCVAVVSLVMLPMIRQIFVVKV